MNEKTTSDHDVRKNSGKRPGPRLSACQWCGKVSCNHCRCTGQMNCSHAPGEMCKNPRYKRRLVCNPCEKNKLKYLQQCQKQAEKKADSAVPAMYGTVPSVTNDKVFPTRDEHGAISSSPNVAILFYNSNMLLSLLPISTFQGSLAQLRAAINNLMLLVMHVHFFFIRDQEIINTEDEPSIRAQDVIRSYQFQFPINCSRCIFIHVPNYTKQVVPFTNSIIGVPQDVIQNPWPKKPSSYVLNPQRIVPFVQPSTIQETPPEAPPDPPARSSANESGLKASYSQNRDSLQWGNLPLSELLIRRVDSGPSYYGSVAHPSDLHAPTGFREEGMSGEYMMGVSPYPRNSLGDMSYMLPYAQRNMFRTQGSSTDMGWPVFHRRTEESIIYPGMDAMEGLDRQSNSGVAMKRDKVMEESKEEEKEEKRSCDRLSLMASIAMNEWKRDRKEGEQ